MDPPSCPSGATEAWGPDQNFNYFDVSFEDPKTGQTLVSSEYVGRFGFNDCEAALDIVFRDLRSKMAK